MGSAFLLSKAFVAAFLVLAFVMTSALPSLAVGGQTGSVSGTVLDSASQPVANANVVFASPSGTYRTTTDAKGEFTLTGLVVDTYSLTLSKTGYKTQSVPGITIIGDQTVGLGTVSFSRELATIGRARARGTNGAFQPTQTQDTFTFSGDRVTEALGKTFSTNQTELIAAAPGTEINKNGNISVRGSLATEIGLNFDGVDYTSVDHGGAVNTFLNGIGSLSVNPGAGDPSSGNSGAGVINLIPKRGTRPAFGLLDLETTSGAYDHQLGAEYGFATPSGRFSNYASFTGDIHTIRRGPYLSDIRDAGGTYPYISAKNAADRDFLDNLVFRFGKDNHESLQALYQTHVNSTGYGQAGQYLYGTINPLAYASSGLSSDLLAQAPNIASLFQGQSSYAQTIAPATSDNNIQHFLKFEYDNNLDASTFLALRLYHTAQQDTFSDPNSTQDGFGGSRSPNLDGGLRTGLNAEFTKQLGKNNIVTLTGKYELQRAIFSINDPFAGLLATSGYGPVGRQDWVDFVKPGNTSAPLTFGTTAAPGANDCPIAGGCWLYYYNTTVAPGALGAGGVPRIPSNLLASPNSTTQFYGASVRDQITLGSKARLDLGLRYEGANYHLPPGADTGNIGPDADTNSPKILEPRASLAYQLSPNDSLRFGYGRSAIFLTLGSMYTPLDYKYYLNAFPKTANSLPSAIPGTNFSNVAPGCGSGEAGANGFPFRACTSYADLIRWEEDYFYPDNGNAKTSTYSTFEASYSHQFKGGVGVKVTPFYRRGYNIIFNGVVASVTDPVSGVVTPLSFRPFYSGFNKSTGVELYVSTPERRTGLGGFFSATYTNAFSNRPAGSPGEDTQPTIPFQALAAGQAYRVGFLSPFVANLGVQYKTPTGLRINPVLRYDRGFPLGIGLTTPVVYNGVALTVPSTNNATTLPVLNLNNGASNSAYNYVDPTNPGTAFNPNIYATRGTPEGPNPGGVLSHARLYTDLTVEFAAHGSHNTFGVQALNLFNNYYSEPIINTRYQPIATGVAGLQTGQTSAAVNKLYAPYGTFNYTGVQNGQSAYLRNPSASPLVYRFYYQLGI